uniref:Chromo domain-containing protein n=1 Tax=Xenopus tropicalis TaxID=8364 RepID=A0A803KB31_XENTR
MAFVPPELLVLNHFSSAQSPPSAILVDGQQEYEVEKILDSRLSRGSLQYLVQWKGFGPEECSWEKDSDVHAPRLVKAFHGQFPQKPRPSGPVGGGRPLTANGFANFFCEVRYISTQEAFILPHQQKSLQLPCILSHFFPIVELHSYNL